MSLDTEYIQDNHRQVVCKIESLRPQRRVCQAYLQLAGKLYVIAAIPSQTYGIV